MPQTERACKHVDTTTRSPSIATMEQFLRGGESSRMSPTYSTSPSSPSSSYFEKVKHHDPEEDQGLYQRKSVLSKVKERAKKLVSRNSLSRRRQDEDNFTPSWGVSLEDEEGEEEDAEYLGAPIYESELAPEEYKENARQHPRANPVISEKRVLKTTKPGEQQDKQNALSPVKSSTTITPQLATSSTTTNSPNQDTTMTHEKLTPTIVDKTAKALTHSASSKPHVTSIITPVAPLSSSMMRNNSSPSSSSPLSHVKFATSPKSPNNSQSLMSPRRSSNGISVIEKVKGAVNSLLRNDEQPQQKYFVKSPTTRANSSQISNTTTHEVGQGAENHGRILQTN
ncbi:hypothetical protein L195_g007777 [Trifolium pratense]|uniref:LTI65/LTI78 N-terminal domain-containing protein n=1 Tax=Trifolium pratense TaxID=57577 RepID=A0A2K3P7A8_TRIPR|nr:uncharacterized protein LOC123896638 [Trifolium pratense]XP_045802984.1 uncharacterized protein LOC123896665 [Trifolium pratense]PNY11174.1 hypothetical protein L195_g007777 [Trifolium pratense]